MSPKRMIRYGSNPSGRKQDTSSGRQMKIPEKDRLNRVELQKFRKYNHCFGSNYAPMELQPGKTRIDSVAKYVHESLYFQIRI